MIHKNTSKAVIYDSKLRHVLMIEKVFPDGSRHYTLPGGVTDPGETLPQALIRECYEEINCTPEVMRLLYVCEFDKPSTDMQHLSRRVEFGFLCTVEDNYTPQVGPIPDSHQVAVCWVELETLNSLSLIPSEIGEVITKRGDVLPDYIGLCPYIEKG